MVASRTIDADDLRRLLHYNPDTGTFTRKVRTSWRARIGDVAGGNINGYWKISVLNQEHYAHRLAWVYIHGELPHGMEIDHINRNKSDNRLCNLRLVTPTQNQMNRGINRDNTSGYKGVTWSKKECRWQAQISIRGKQTFIGYFQTAEQAHVAYKVVAIGLHGGYASFI